MIYKNFQNYVNNRNNLREVDLFKCLLGAINAESNAYAWEQHGFKGFVDFIFSKAFEYIPNYSLNDIYNIKDLENDIITEVFK